MGFTLRLKDISAFTLERLKEDPQTLTLLHEARSFKKLDNKQVPEICSIASRNREAFITEWETPELSLV